MILTALVSEIFVSVKGEQYRGSLDELVNQSISAINDAEDNAGNQHFVSK
jgi:hypothetical protein